jgi:hypothetical protein
MTRGLTRAILEENMSDGDFAALAMTLQAFSGKGYDISVDEVIKRREANKDNELMVFDWDKAATIIKDTSSQTASAGLRDCWEPTGGEIFKNGKPVPHDETHVYLASIWAVPELKLENGDIVPCFKMQPNTPGWDSYTYWPESALQILNG